MCLRVTIGTIESKICLTLSLSMTRIHGTDFSPIDSSHELIIIKDQRASIASREKCFDRVKRKMSYCGFWPFLRNHCRLWPLLLYSFIHSKDDDCCFSTETIIITEQQQQHFFGSRRRLTIKITLTTIIHFYDKKEEGDNNNNNINNSSSHINNNNKYISTMFRQRAQLLLSRTLSVASIERKQACNNNNMKNTVTLPTQTSSSYRTVSTMSTSDSTFSSSSSCSFWNTTTALIAAVVATSDYVSPNKPTDCCGMVDDSRSSNKGTSSYSFNNNNSNEKDIDNGDGGDRGDGGGQSRDGNRQGTLSLSSSALSLSSSALSLSTSTTQHPKEVQSPPPPRPVHFDDSSNGSGSHRASATTVYGTGGVNAYWKDVFSDSSKLIPNFGTTPNAATHDSRYNEKREACHADPNHEFKLMDADGNMNHPMQMKTSATAVTSGSFIITGSDDSRKSREMGAMIGTTGVQASSPDSVGSAFSTIDFSSSAAASSSNQSILPVDLDVLPSQVVSSTSDAMWMLAPPLSSVLEKEFAIANTLEEFGLGDHDGDDQLPYEFWFDKLEVVPDSNISNSTMNVPTNTTTHKRKGKRKSTWDVNGGEYVDPAEDSQDYSKSDGLVYSKDPHANGLKLDGEPLDEEKVKEGRWYLHATPEANLFDRTLTNLEPHSFDLEGGIMAQGLKPMVQKGKKSKKPIRGVWAVPGGRAPWTIAHLVRTHKEALKKSGGKVALIMIYADDDRIKNFIPFRPGGKWSESCHPAYSREEIPVYPKDVFIVDIKELPMFLKQTKVRMDLIPLRTDAQKKATYDLWYHHKGGKEKQAAWHHEWSYKNGGKKYHADRYYNGGGKEKQTEQYHEQGGKEKRAERHAAKSNRPRRSPRCTDTSLGPNGVFQCRFDTLPHIRLPKKGDQPRCALHKWAGKSKQGGISYCESCNVHLCIDCFTTFHTNFDLVTVKNQLLKTDPEELGAHAALVRQQQQQQSLQSAAASSSSSSAPLLGWTGGTVLQGNNGGGGGCGTPSSSPLSSTLSSSSLSTLSSTLSSSTFGNNNLCTNDNILVDAKMINESQKALIESMKRSIASRKLVEIFATTSRK